MGKGFLLGGGLGVDEKGEYNHRNGDGGDEAAGDEAANEEWNEDCGPQMWFSISDTYEQESLTSVQMSRTEARGNLIHR